MAVELEGGCRVTEMHEGLPRNVGSLRIWNQVGRNTGAQAISLRILEFGPGLSPGLRNDSSDEVFYVLEPLQGAATESSCRVLIDGQSFEVGQQTGVYLRPGQTLFIDNEGPEAVTLVSSQCPESVNTTEFVEVIEAAHQEASAKRVPFIRLAERKALPTADRWYRVLVDDSIGSERVTQFVGSIPPGRAPDHFHQYEEVLFILRGEGRMWAGTTSTLIGPGSCIYLPRGQVHCVENTGKDELRLLGVFYPSGSPAVRYEV